MKPTHAKYLATTHHKLDPLNYKLTITFQQHPNKQPPPHDPTPHRTLAYWTNNHTTTLPHLILELKNDIATYQPQGDQQPHTNPDGTLTAHYTRYQPITHTPQQLLQQTLQLLTQ